jgi:hypothetical protein
LHEAKNVSNSNGGPKMPSPEAEAMYGSRWQAALAADIGENVRTVRFWLAGERTPPAIALKRTRLAAQRQVARIQRVLAQHEPPAA